MLASNHLGRTLGLFAALLLLAGCEHGEGGICQANRDCEDGLVCDLSVEDRGVCRSPEDIDAGTDAGALPDAGPLNPDASDAGSGGGSGGAASDAGTAGAPAVDSGTPPIIESDPDGGDADGG